jgi:subtilisin family serine protease
VRLKRFFIILTFIFSLAFFNFNIFASEIQNNIDNYEFLNKKEILIKYKVNINGITRKSMMYYPDLKLEKSFRNSNLDLFEIESTSNIDQIASELMKNSNIEYIQPNYMVHVNSIPTDSRSLEQWGLSNIGQFIGNNKGTKGMDINAMTAWDYEMGDPDVVIGVMDTGIDIDGTELRNSIYINANEIGGNGLDDDNNGYIDDINGWDFYSHDKDVSDNNIYDGHGSLVTGL